MQRSTYRAALGVTASHRRSADNRTVRSVRRVILAMLAATSAGGLGTASASWIAVQHYEVRDGLAQSQVTEICQDPRGYLWMATLGGLSRFDGRRFVTYGTRDGLPDDMITAMRVTAAGGLILGTDSGYVALWDADSGQVTNAVRLDAPARVTALAVLEPEAILVGTDRGLWRWNPPHPPRRLDDHPVTALVALPDARAAALGKPDRIVGKGGSLTDAWWSKSTASPVTAVASRAGQGLIMGLADGSIVVEQPPGAQRRVATLDDPPVATLLHSSTGDIWAGTASGVVRIAPEGTGRQRLRLQPDGSPVSVTALCEDREGGVWVGTWGDGLYQLAQRGIDVLGPDTGLPDDTVWSFLEDNAGCMLMGTERHGVLRRCGDRTTPVIEPGREIPADTQVFSLASGPDDALWMGTSRGIFRYRSGAPTRHWTTRDGLPSDEVVSIRVTNEGTLWAATRHGLARLEAGRLRAWTRSDGLPDDTLHDIALDREENLWIATHSAGLIRFDGTRFVASEDDTWSPRQRVWCVRVDSRDLVWAGTSGGLLFRMASGGPTHVVDADAGLPSRTVLFLVPGPQGDIWAGTTRGIARITPSGSVAQVLTAKDGLSGDEVNEGAVGLARDGTLWFAAPRGVTTVVPGEIHPDPNPPLLVIESMQVNGRSYGRPFPISSGMPVPQPFLTLPAGTREVRFDFVGLSLRSPEKLRYRFRLEGFDTRGSLPTDDTHVVYRGLQARRYRFVLEAANGDGVWTPDPLVVTFTVAPFWYATTWFRLLVLLVAVAVGYATLRFRLRSHHRRQHRLEEQVAMRTAELNEAYRRIAEQNALLQNLSRTDPLTGLRNRRVLAEQLPTEMALRRREIVRRGPTDLASFRGAVLYLIDLDGFKLINDRYGHEVGDKILVAVAGVIQSTMREGDLAVRWGGDELIVLARDVDAHGAVFFARRLLRRIASLEIPAGPGETLRVRATVGFVPYPVARQDFLSTEQWGRLVETADRLLYLAKARVGIAACGLRVTGGGAAGLDERAVFDRVAHHLDDLGEGLSLAYVSLADESDDG